MKIDVAPALRAKRVAFAHCEITSPYMRPGSSLHHPSTIR